MEEFDVDAQMKRLSTQKPSTSGHKAPQVLRYGRASTYTTLVKL